MTANKAANQISTHGAIANFIDHFQVIIMNQKPVAVRRRLRGSRYN